MSGFDLFPGFKTSPTDESRDMKWKREALTLRLVAPDAVECVPEADIDDLRDDVDEDGEPYCDRCQNSGYINCFCGGDLCVCMNFGEEPCPACGGW